MNIRPLPRAVCPRRDAGALALESGEWKRRRSSSRARRSIRSPRRSHTSRAHWARRARRSGRGGSGSSGSRAARSADGGEERAIGRPRSKCKRPRRGLDSAGTGQGADAVARMREAADLEDRTEKHIVTPGRSARARAARRHAAGDEAARPIALKEYEASQQREPNRFPWPVRRGAGGAAGGRRRGKAKRYFSKLIELAGSGDLRPEMEAARRYLASN